MVPGMRKRRITRHWGCSLTVVLMWLCRPCARVVDAWPWRITAMRGGVPKRARSRALVMCVFFRCGLRRLHNKGFLEAKASVALGA